MPAQQAAGIARRHKGLRVRYLLSGALAPLFISAEIPAANAVVCARGVYRAGCVGPRGAVVTRRPVVAPRYYYYTGGVRVCRWITLGGSGHRFGGETAIIIKIWSSTWFNKIGL